MKKRGRPADYVPMSTAPIPGEEWRPVVGYELFYSVSSEGRVRRDTPTQHGPAGYILKPVVKTNGGVGRKRYSGYLGVRLVGEAGITKNKRIASLVARAFLGEAPIGAQINHIDGNKANNTAANLEYVTPKENRQHASRIGLNAMGTKHGSARLTEEQVRAIRKDETWSLRKIAAKYGVANTTILNIRNRKTWRHLP